jgi:hypothetical protein
VPLLGERELPDERAAGYYLRRRAESIAEEGGHDGQTELRGVGGRGVAQRGHRELLQWEAKQVRAAPPCSIVGWPRYTL